MFGILARSQVVRVGMFGEGHPYVVPVSFGMEVAGGADVLDILLLESGDFSPKESDKNGRRLAEQE